MNTLIGTRFGNIDYQEESIVTFDNGLIGLSSLNQFVILPHKPGSPFQWLQSLDEPSLAFLTVDPFHFVKEYDPKISSSDVGKLGLSEESEPAVLVTASIPGGQVDLMTVNLAAPIVINVETRVAKQVVLEGDAYTIKHRIFPESSTEAELSAA